MAWTMKGTWYEACSCKMICGCNLGPAQPDQGWCSGVLGFAVESGESNGVDLSGAKLVLHAELPGDFLGGIDKAQLYLDPSAPQDQRDELVAVFKGERGGVWEGVAGMIGEFLPPKAVDLEVSGGDRPRVRVGDFIDMQLELVKDENGKQAVLVNAPLSAGFAVETLELAMASGKASDPDLRQWESLGNGAAVPFDWSF